MLITKSIYWYMEAYVYIAVCMYTYMYMYIYIYIYVYTYIYVYIYIYIYIYMCVYIYINKCKTEHFTLQSFHVLISCDALVITRRHCKPVILFFIYMYIHTWINLQKRYTYINLCVYMSIYIHIYLNICVYMYIYIHIYACIYTYRYISI